MTRMAVDPGALEAWAADAERVRARMVDSLARADVVVSRLDAGWDGTASALFADHYADWRGAADRLTSTLDRLVGLVGDARTNYRAAVVANDRMWPTAVPVVAAMAAPPGGFDADPDDFRAASGALTEQGERLDTAWHALATELGATGGMAGADPAGAAFGRDHDALVAALWSGWAAARDVVRALADTVAATGDNLLRAEHASTADRVRPPEPLPRSPAPAPAPPLPPVAAATEPVPTEIAAWPTGDRELLVAAAQAWRRAAAALTDVSTATTSTVRGLTAAATASSLDRLEAYVETVVRDECLGGFFAVLRSSCERLARACELLHEQIGRTRQALIEAVAAGIRADEWYHPVALLLDRTIARGAARWIAAGGDYLLFQAAAERARADHEQAVAELCAGMVAAAEQLTAETAVLPRPEPVTAEVIPVTPPEPAPAVVLGPDVRTIDPPPLLVSRAQIEKKYEQHAAALGVSAPRGKEGFAQLEAAVHAFVDNPQAVHIDGTFRSEPMIIHYQPAQHLVVLQTHDGSFVSGWVLTADQEKNVAERGSL